jgi:hypothetical protein
VLFLITNIHVYKNLQDGIDSFAPHKSIITDEDARMPPYLEAVIKEGAPMQPPATGLILKSTYPRKTPLTTSSYPRHTNWKIEWAIQRNKKYGEEISVSRPER